MFNSARDVSGRSSASRTLDVPARVHKPRGYPSSAESTDDEVPEVTVVLHPPSEKRALREQLAIAQQTVVAQRAALQAAHDALSALGASEAAAAVAAALTAEPPTPARSTTMGTIIMEPPHLVRPEPVRELPATAPRGVEGETSSNTFRTESPAALDIEPAMGADAAAVDAEDADAKAEAGGVAAPAATPTAVVAEATPAKDEWVEEGGKPKAGFTIRDDDGWTLIDGDGTQFDLRVGPDYKKNGKKAPSAMHTYRAVTIDVFKRKSILFHAASKLTLPPPPDGKATPNTSGLPRRLVVNVVIPQEAPSMFNAPSDGPCYQVIIVFCATAEALTAWQASGAPASKLFARFAQNAPEGLLPTTGDADIKERLKLLPKADNMKALNLNWISGYNGKPAVLTKSGSVYRGDDYLEVAMNTFRFGEPIRARHNIRTVVLLTCLARCWLCAGLMTRKGISAMLEKVAKADLHAAITIEGRDDSELPEQTLAAARIRGLDMAKLAKDGDYLDGA